MLLSPESKEFKGGSVFGEWIMKDGLPVFNYKADPRTHEHAEWVPFPRPATRRHFHFIGNKAVSFMIDNFGTNGMWDELECNRWLTESRLQEGGTGFTTIVEADGEEWGTNVFRNPEDVNPERHFGPFAFGVYPSRNGLNVERDMIMPEGDVPWAFVRVRVSLDEGQPVRTFKLQEEWALKPLYMAYLEHQPAREEMAKEVSYDITMGKKIVAQEIFSGDKFGGETGKPAKMMIESLNGDFGAVADGEQHPTFVFSSEVTLEAGQTKEFYFRFGRFDEAPIADVEGFYEANLEATKARLPKASCEEMPYMSAEIVWDAAAIYGMVFKDAVLGDFTINQGSAYGFESGWNAAPRDPLQYATAMTYVDPKLSLETIRNTIAWGWSNSDLPFTITADKKPDLCCYRPSDMNLWVILAACDYAAMTGDLKAFEEMVSYSPFDKDAKDVTLKDALIGHYRFFVDFVGRGAGNHPRIMNADWQDGVIHQFKQGYTDEEMMDKASSVFNTGLGAWVLPQFAGLLEKLGEAELAKEVRAEGADLRKLMGTAHNGKYFWRAVTPDGKPVGDNICWVEVQAMGLLCGAAEDVGIVDSILEFIEENNAKDSPLGARTRFPLTGCDNDGSGAQGGIWYSLNEFITFGAAKCGRQDWAMRNHEKMSLRTKTETYPTQWHGVLSGPDTWDAPESKFAGFTWMGMDTSIDLEAMAAMIEQAKEKVEVDIEFLKLCQHMSMSAFPVNNTHSHTNPILGFVHSGGVYVDENCNLVVGKGVNFEAPHWKLNKDGSGWIISEHEITVTSPNGTFTGTGKVEF